MPLGGLFYKDFEEAVAIQAGRSGVKDLEEHRITLRHYFGSECWG